MLEHKFLNAPCYYQTWAQLRETCQNEFSLGKVQPISKRLEEIDAKIHERIKQGLYIPVVTENLYRDFHIYINREAIPIFDMDEESSSNETGIPSINSDPYQNDNIGFDVYYPKGISSLAYFNVQNFFHETEEEMINTRVIVKDASLTTLTASVIVDGIKIKICRNIENEKIRISLSSSELKFNAGLYINLLMQKIKLSIDDYIREHFSMPCINFINKECIDPSSENDNVNSDFNPFLEQVLNSCVPHTPWTPVHRKYNCTDVNWCNKDVTPTLSKALFQHLFSKTKSENKETNKAENKEDNTGCNNKSSLDSSFFDSDLTTESGNDELDAKDESETKDESIKKEYNIKIIRNKVNGSENPKNKPDTDTDINKNIEVVDLTKVLADAQDKFMKVIGTTDVQQLEEQMQKVLNFDEKKIMDGIRSFFTPK